MEPLPTLNLGTAFVIPRVVGQQRILLVTNSTPGSASVSSFSLRGGANSSIVPPFVVLDPITGLPTLSYDHGIDFELGAEVVNVVVTKLPPPTNVKNARVNIFQIETPTGLTFLLKMSPFSNIPSTIQLTAGIASEEVEMITEIRRVTDQQKGVGMRESDSIMASGSVSYIFPVTPTATQIPFQRGTQMIAVTYPPTGQGEYFEFEIENGISGEFPNIVSPLGNAMLRQSPFRASVADVSSIFPEGRVERDGTFAVTDLSGRTWTFNFYSNPMLNVSPTIQQTGGPIYSGDMIVDVTKFDFF